MKVKNKLVSDNHHYNFTSYKKQALPEKTASDKKNTNLNSNPIANLNRAKISFGAMKKSQFQGIDLMMVKRLKAPIDSFNSVGEFQEYCQAILDEKYLGKDNIERFSKSFDAQAQIQKKAILEEWTDYIVNENDAYNPAIQLMILSSITKGLSEKTNHLPPILNKRKLADTIYEISQNCKADKKYDCNFDKLYRHNLQTSIIQEETQLDENLNGWVVIPGYENDPDNFQENVKKLQILSHNNWCTKTFNAEPYLKEGDFHIYLENCKPKVGLRFQDDWNIEEIQGTKNDGKIPIAYAKIIQDYIQKNNYSMDNEISLELDLKTKLFNETFEPLVEQIGQSAIKNKDYEKILPFFGIDVVKDEDGKFILSSYNSTLYDSAEISMSFEDLGLDQNDFLKQVKEIKGDAFFDEMVETLGNLEKIRGNVLFFNKKLGEFGRNSKIKTLDKLQYVGGNLSLQNCNELNSLGNLSTVEGDLNLTNTKIKSAKQIKALKHIGGTLYLITGGKILHPQLLLEETPYSRPLSFKEYQYRAKNKLKTPVEIQAFINLIDMGTDIEEAAYQAQFASIWGKNK